MALDRRRLSRAVLAALALKAEILRAGNDERETAARTRRLHREAADFAQRRGIDTRSVIRAAHGQPLQVDRFLGLSAALGLDPVTLRRAGRRMAPLAGPVSWDALKVGIAVWKAGGNKRQRTVRDLAARARVGRMTAARAASGRKVGDACFVALCRAMNRHPHDFTAAFHADVSRKTSGGTKPDFGRAEGLAELEKASGIVRRMGL